MKSGVVISFARNRGLARLPHALNPGRDIALRCPRPRTSGRNGSGAGRVSPSHVAPLVRGADGAARRPYLGVGEGGPGTMHILSLLVLVFSLTLDGCSQKPAAEVVAPEFRGEPIAPLAAKMSAPSTASSNTAAVAAAPANSKLEARNSEPTFALAGFDILSGYNIEISDELLGPVTNNLAEVSARTEALIPAKVKALDKKRVALKGFMLPLKVEGGLVTEMLIMKDQSMCCYGTVPKIHEWVSIKMTEKGVKPTMDQPVTLFGKLHVGEMRENGYLTGIYRMDGEKMAAPEE